MKGTSGSEDSRNETPLLRPDGKIKPLPPIPSRMSAENEQVKEVINEHQEKRGSVPGQTERRDGGETDREASAPAAPPRPDSLTDPNQDDGLGVLTLQRSKPANMKEKVEKWRERRSEIMVLDRTLPENRRIGNLK